MAERDSRTPASNKTAGSNAYRIAAEMPTWKDPVTLGDADSITDKLRKELGEKGIKGFKRGGKVKKTGVYKLHKGEKVKTRSQAKKDEAMLRRKKMPR
jgi:hypothetical protein